LAILILVFFSSALLLWMGDAGAARNSMSSRLVFIRVGRMLAFGWGVVAAIGAVAGMMPVPIVYPDPDIMSGIQEINDQRFRAW
jgi:branched-chain amino acid transport system permease protein